MRLFLKCLKYSTLDLTIWPGETVATIAHLEELQKILLKFNKECLLLLSDLIFVRYLDQNCDAAIRIFTLEVANLLLYNVPGSSGSVLYIKAVSVHLGILLITQMKCKKK